MRPALGHRLDRDIQEVIALTQRLKSLDEQVFTSETYVRHFLPKEDVGAMEAAGDLADAKLGGGFMPGY